MPSGLELSLGLGRRQVVFAAAELAILAVERGDAERAGRLWGAVESEVSSGPVGGQWERHHQELERLVLRADGPAFSLAQEQGSLMSIGEAAGLVPAS